MSKIGKQAEKIVQDWYRTNENKEIGKWPFNGDNEAMGLFNTVRLELKNGSRFIFLNEKQEIGTL